MKIIVKNISHTFNKNTPLEFLAIKNVSSQINQGEYIGIIGQSGSGKTTFIEHLNSLLVPTEGVINWIFEHELIRKKETELSKKSRKISEIQNISLKKTWRRKFKHSKKIRQHIGIVFQFAEYQLFESTIEKDIMFGPISFGVSKEDAKKRAAIYLKAVGLPEEFLEKNPLSLSGGQKRRVALAGILAIEPEVLILDEPTAGLDPAGVQEILNIFDNLNKEGKTIIMVTHDMDNILERTNRTIVFSNGIVIKDDETYKIMNDDFFIRQNNLVTPSIIHVIKRIEEKFADWNIPKIRNIDQLSNFLNDKIKEKRAANE